MKTRLRTLFCICALLALAGLIWNPAAEACTDLVVPGDQIIVSARNMDFGQEMFTKLVIHPRGTKRTSILGQPGDNLLSWESKYGSVTFNSFGVSPSDGLNEHGLSAALLWLVETEWPKQDSRPALSLNYWAVYCLDNFKTVAEAKEGLKKVRVYSTAIEGLNDNQVVPIHLILRDATGDSAVFEYLKGELVIHHPMEQLVCTNDPHYSKQLENLKNYRAFGGTLPLPGDVDSASRFVRAAFFLRKAPVSKTPEEAVSLAYSVIKTVSVPTGANNTSDNQNTMSSRTLWTSVRDHKNKIYYFTTVNNPVLQKLPLSKLDFTAGQPMKELDINTPLGPNPAKQFKPMKDTETIKVK